MLYREFAYLQVFGICWGGGFEPIPCRYHRLSMEDSQWEAPQCNLPVGKSCNTDISSGPRSPYITQEAAWNGTFLHFLQTTSPSLQDMLLTTMVVKVQKEWQWGTVHILLPASTVYYLGFADNCHSYRLYDKVLWINEIMHTFWCMGWSSQSLTHHFPIICMFHWKIYIKSY